MGLLFSPHTSSGRLPTDLGLRIFVDGLLEIRGELSQGNDWHQGKMFIKWALFPKVLEEASSALSGLMNVPA